MAFWIAFVWLVGFLLKLLQNYLLQMDINPGSADHSVKALIFSSPFSFPVFFFVSLLVFFIKTTAFLLCCSLAFCRNINICINIHIISKLTSLYYQYIQINSHILMHWDWNVCGGELFVTNEQFKINVL